MYIYIYIERERERIWGVGAQLGQALAMLSRPRNTPCTFSSVYCGEVQPGLTLLQPGGDPGANLKSISHRCYLREVAFEWELTKETIYLTLGCLQGGPAFPLRANGAFPSLNGA